MKYDDIIKLLYDYWFYIELEFAGEIFNRTKS
jgi:hypothetical protein